uniref:Uncharacterized protein n=1 Tax=Romanomermis culicivorax TaxID=13658 RepID=A0A915KHE8_ROMCU
MPYLEMKLPAVTNPQDLIGNNRRFQGMNRQSAESPTVTNCHQLESPTVANSNPTAQFILPVRPQAKISTSLLQPQFTIPQVNRASNTTKSAAAAVAPPSSSTKNGNAFWNWAVISGSRLVQTATPTTADEYSQAWEYRALKRKEGFEYALTQQALFKTMEKYHRRNLAQKSFRNGGSEWP